LRFPGSDLIGVDVEVFGQLGYRSIALDGGKRHFSLEARCVVPARSSAHGLSCSRRLSPFSGRNSTYRPVQISAAGSIMATAENRDGVAVLIAAPDAEVKSVRVNITLPADVLSEIDRYAEREGFTRSGFLAQAAKKAMAGA
jgi:hypothetical protein